MVLFGNDSADGVDDDLPGLAQRFFVPKERLGIAMFRVCSSAAARNWGGRREPTHTEGFNDHQDLLGRESGAYCSLSLGGLDGGKPAPIGLCASDRTLA